MLNKLYFTSEVKSNFEEELSAYSGNPKLQFLQIGAYVGHASEWLLTNILTNNTSFLVDVDIWDPSVSVWPGPDPEKEYDIRLSNFQNIIKTKLSSADFFDNNKYEFDFIYIDGGVWGAQTYFDGVRGFNCLRTNGVMAFDDYLLNGTPGPRQASINRFIKEYKEVITVKKLRDQVWIVKNSPINF
jgi:hypothetical protein